MRRSSLFTRRRRDAIRANKHSRLECSVYYRNDRQIVCVSVDARKRTSRTSQKKMRRRISGSVLSVLVFLLSSHLRADDAGFRPIFDGQSLSGWEAPEPEFWSVEDGAITGRSTPKMPCQRNQYLTWARGTIDDFELKLKFRISGSPKANSGIQIRAAIEPDGHAVGYQADIDVAGNWRGALYDEKTDRRALAKPGQHVSIELDGKRNSTSLAESRHDFKVDDWNDYHITCAGPKITLKINGKTTAVVVDEEKAHRDLWGRLALQLHSGPPMTIQFKDIQLKRLPLTDRRKKIVLVAGHPSHGSGQHEHNAGIKLLTRRLQELDGVIATSYHDNGWPEDSTAFDNANGMVFYADGGRGHPVNKHLEKVEALTARGVGMMCIHYGVEVPRGEIGSRFQKWIGGYYEDRYSSNPHWDAELRVHTDHPVGRGVEPTSVHDEWYFNIRFRNEMNGVTSILEATPSDKTRARNGYPPEPYPHIIEASGRSETLMWAVEREDGGRGVGFTGGHWHRNWAIDAQRRVVLNAMVWMAGGVVPQGGVESDPVTEEELNRDLDKKGEMVRVKVPK